jgi:ATP synthase protein I
MAYNAAVPRMSDDPYHGLSQVGGLGFTFVAFVLVFTAIGYVLDRWLHTGPWLMVAGVFVGAGMGFAYIVRILFARPDRCGDGGRRER